MGTGGTTSASSLEIRATLPSDAAELSSLLAQLGYPRDADLAPDLARLQRDPNARVVVAVRDGMVVGLATLYIVPVLHETGPWCRLTALVVDSWLRRSAAATALVGHAEAIAREVGCVRIEATSHRRRRDAHRFYTSLGYTEVSRHFLKTLASRPDALGREASGRSRAVRDP